MRTQATDQPLRTTWLSTVHFDLSEQGYVDIRPPPGLALVMVRKTLHELVHKIAGVVECKAGEPTPASAMMLCNDFLTWSEAIRGINGLAVVVFVFADPDEATIRALLAPDRATQECPVARAVYHGLQQRYWYWQSMQGLLASHKVPA